MNARKRVNAVCRIQWALFCGHSSKPLGAHAYHNALQYLASPRYARDAKKAG